MINAFQKSGILQYAPFPFMQNTFHPNMALVDFNRCSCLSFHGCRNLPMYPNVVQRLNASVDIDVDRPFPALCCPSVQSPVLNSFH